MRCPTDDPKFDRCRELFRLAFRLRRRLYLLNRDAAERYGVAGNMVSGGHFEHWPQDAKQRSRRLNRAVNRINDAAFAARPRYVRTATLRDLRYSIEMKEALG